MDEGSAERRLAAILSADAVGYSRLMAADEAATVRTLNEYRDLIAALVEGRRGRVVDFTGDNALCEFPSALDAAQSALAIQEAIDQKNAALPMDRVMAFRIGLHLGDVLVEGERIYGDGVNIAARLESLASPGGICISAPVHDQVKNKLTARFEDLGDQEVKNIPDPVHVWRLQRSEAALATAPRTRGRRVRWQVPLATVGVLALASAAVWLLRPEWITGPPATGIVSGSPTIAPIPARPSVRVQPFENLSGDPEQAYFAAGMADDLVTDLSRVSGLDVIGNEGDARYLVKGSVRRSDEEIRINAQLMDASTGQQLWAERYDRPLHDLFAVQDEVTAQIVRALHVELSEPEIRKLAERPTANIEAYDELLRGERLVVLVSQENLERAQQHYKRALALDPTLAEAGSALTRAQFVAWIWQWSDELDLDAGLVWARRAVELDPESPAAARMLGLIHLWRKELDAAVRELRRAADLAPQSGPVLSTLGSALVFSDHVPEGLAAARRGIEYGSRIPLAHLTVGRAERKLGRREKSIAAFERALEVLPTSAPALANLAVLYDEVGRTQDSLSAVARLREISPGFSGVIYAERMSYRDPLDTERLAQGLARVGLP